MCATRVLHNGIDETVLWSFAGYGIHKLIGNKVVYGSADENIGGYQCVELNGSSSYLNTINSEYIPVMTQHKGSGDFITQGSANWADPRQFGPGVSVQRVYANILPRAYPLLPSPLEVVVSTGNIVFEWYVVDPDGDDQQAKYQLYIYDSDADTGYYVDGSGLLVSGETPITSTVCSAYVAAGEITGNDGGYVWRICVADAHDAWGPWSENQKFYVAEIPVIEWLVPQTGETITSNHPIFTVYYTEPDEQMCAFYVLNIYDSLMTLVYSSGETTLNVNTEQYANIYVPFELTNNSVYTAEIYVKDIGGSVSATKSVTFITAFEFPQGPSITVSDYSSSNYLGIFLSSTDEYMSYFLHRYSVLSSDYISIAEIASPYYSYFDYGFPVNVPFRYKVVTIDDNNCTTETYSDEVYISTDMANHWYLANSEEEIGRKIYIESFRQSPTRAIQEYEPIGRTSAVVIGNNAKGNSGAIEFFVFSEDAKNTIVDLDTLCASNYASYIKNPFGEVYNVAFTTYEVVEMQQNRLVINAPFIEVGDA